MRAHVDAAAVVYHYDPLDRLISVAPTSRAKSGFFYCNDRMTSLSQGLVWRRIFQQGSYLLAQGQGSVFSLLSTDAQFSVLCVLNGHTMGLMTYSAYGYRAPDDVSASVLGFNGERVDELTGHYLLGNGYRALNPVLMRFNSPDSLSPFGSGGLNAYAYCTGDPVNKTDSTGHFSLRRSISVARSTPGFSFVDPRDAASRPNLGLLINEDEAQALNSIATILYDPRVVRSPSVTSTAPALLAPVEPVLAGVGPASLQALSARQLPLQDLAVLSGLHPRASLANAGSLLRLKEHYMAAPSRLLFARNINAGRVPGINKADLPVALQDAFSRIRGG